jgi:hypothetical protein
MFVLTVFGGPASTGDALDATTVARLPGTPGE